MKTPQQELDDAIILVNAAHAQLMRLLVDHSIRDIRLPTNQWPMCARKLHSKILFMEMQLHEKFEAAE